MTSTPLPPDDGENNHASELPTGLRLSDAERIATQRLDGAAEGSLAEALAIAPADNAAKAGPPLADGAEAAGERLPAELRAPCLEATPGIDIGGAEPIQADEPEPSPPAPVEDGAADSLMEGVAVPSSAVTGVAAYGGLMAKPAEDLYASAGVTPEATAVAPSPGVGVAQSVQPLATARDAAAKLVADANAAAAALESLKRLLERQLPNVSAGPEPLPPRADAEAAPAAPTVPPPLPIQVVGDAGGLPDSEPQLPVPVPTRRLPAERGRLDVRGFLAGFALSWAFGVVLYLFMTAG